MPPIVVQVTAGSLLRVMSGDKAVRHDRIEIKHCIFKNNYGEIMLFRYQSFGLFVCTCTHSIGVEEEYPVSSSTLLQVEVERVRSVQVEPWNNNIAQTKPL